MPDLVVTSRPIIGTMPAYLLLADEARGLRKYSFDIGKPIMIKMSDASTKYCVGWYDVDTHTNHVCEDAREVDSKYESCFECRKRTGFNPAFYNSTELSDVQARYNSKPHSVYVAYFGDGLAKAGMMSDSRGLERLYEQGALLYSIVGTYENADTARDVESKLIGAGLKNSVTKRQKEQVLTRKFDQVAEQEKFTAILRNLDLSDGDVKSNIDLFFFGEYPSEPIAPIGKNPMSGIIRGVVGRYLVLENNEMLYGIWLSDLAGYEITISEEVESIAAQPRQISLF